MSIQSTATITEVEYRDIEGFPGYRVGNDGSVWSKKRLFGMWNRLSPSKMKAGYLQVVLCRKGKPHTTRVHCLVLLAFVGPCPEGMEACHFPDRNPANNNLDNLRWDTPKNNYADQVNTARQREVSDTGGLN